MTTTANAADERTVDTKWDIARLILGKTWTGKIVLFFAFVHLIQTVVIYQYGMETMVELFGFTAANLSAGSVTAAVLSVFSHGNLFHLAINAVVFLQFAFVVEARKGATSMFALFLAAGVAGAFAQIGLAGILGTGATAPVIGASGGVCALVAAVAFLHPNDEITIYIPIPVTAEMWKIVAGAAAFTAAIILVFGPAAAGFGHAAHLTGFVLGGVAGLAWFSDESANGGDYL